MKLAKSLATLATGICLLSNPSFAQNYSKVGILNIPLYTRTFSMWLTNKNDYCFTDKLPKEKLQELINKNIGGFFRFNRLVDSGGKKDFFISSSELEKFQEKFCFRTYMEDNDLYKQSLSMYVTRKFDYCSTKEVPIRKDLRELVKENHEIRIFNKLIDTQGGTKDEDYFLSNDELLAFKKSHCSRAPKNH